MTTETQKRMHEQQLERFIDTIGLPYMLEVLSNICQEKASHVRENWQDENLAKKWDKNSKMLSSLSPKLYS